MYREGANVCTESVDDATEFLPNCRRISGDHRSGVGWGNGMRDGTLRNRQAVVILDSVSGKMQRSAAESAAFVSELKNCIIKFLS